MAVILYKCYKCGFESNIYIPEKEDKKQGRICKHCGNTMALM